MPRKPRIEYAGAVYHVMSRGDRGEAIFRIDADRETFLAALGEVCTRTGWLLHAYVLMGNHYHLLLETPEPNLVAGMQWLQSTYTKRFNVRHRVGGHVFQGRYKAIPVDSEGDYFGAVADYIHLNPVRVRGYDFLHQRLEAHTWSSFPVYVGRVRKPAWLTRSRVLGALGLADTAAGRRRYGARMAGRVEEVRHSDEPWRADEAWEKIRRGWQVGGAEFQERLLDRLSLTLGKGRRESYSGESVDAHDEHAAQRWISAGMKALGLVEADWVRLRKNSAEKCALAWLVRRHTAVRTAWIKARLRMGTATGLSQRLKKLEGSRPGGWGYEKYQIVRNIIL